MRCSRIRPPADRHRPSGSRRGGSRASVSGGTTCCRTAAPAGLAPVQREVFRAVLQVMMAW